MERKHTIAQRIARDQLGTGGYEKRLVSEMTEQHIHDLGSWSHRSGIVEPKDAPETLADALRTLRSDTVGKVFTGTCYTSSQGMIFLAATSCFSILP